MSDTAHIQTTERWWSPPQVAAGLNVSAHTVRNWIAAGLLKAGRFGGVWRISDSDLQAFIRRAHAEAESIRAGNAPTDHARQLAELSRTRRKEYA